MLAAMLASRPVSAYSVLSHEANIDALWDSSIKPLLHQQFPLATTDDIQHARAFAYGGSVIQDLGYYPFGSHFFSNLVHYVRSGDFVEALIHDAGDIDEYAFALGALAHYAADNLGHPIAVNRAVPMMYPELKKKYGDEVRYADSPASHILVEFSFDVLQVAAGSYAPEKYHDFIGFEVSKTLLERAFFETYGLKMEDVFLDEDLTIGTYRYAVSQAIPHMTDVAWRQKHDAIDKAAPGARRQQFVFNLSRQEYEKQYGARYRKPNLMVRILAFLYRLVPRIGPFRVLSFKSPTPQAEKLFLDSFQEARDRFKQSLDALMAGRMTLANTDFDTGKPTRRGEYGLADETYDDLLDKLAGRRFADVSSTLRTNLIGYYDTPEGAPPRSRKERKRAERTHRELIALAAASTTSSRR
jgi:zinc dependent phospholipase C